MDIVIIGGGIIGCSIAYEFSRYKLIIELLEQESDLCYGASGANTGLIHAGFDPPPGSLKAKFNSEGNRLIPQLAHELEVPFKQIGALVVGYNDSDISKLEKLKCRGLENGVSGLKILQQEEIHNLEPALNKDINGALFAPSAGIISPYEFTIALAENAAINGVKIRLSTRVMDIIVKHNSIKGIKTPNGRLNCRYVINAAGLFADKIASLAGLDTFTITPSRGEYLILDKRVKGLVNHTLFPLPRKVSKGIVVTPTVDGNIMLGPNAEEIENKSDNITTARGQANVINGSLKLVPRLNVNEVICRFAGIRTIPNTNDFIIGPTELEGFINVAGISSPGLTSAPAIAKHVVQIIADEENKKLLKKEEYIKGRPQRFIPRLATPQKHHENIQQNSAFGHVLCRCEHVTSGEVISELHRPVPVTTLKGVKLRTRAGMGRCQGAFCSQRLIFLLSHELNIPVEKVTLSGEGSEILIKSNKGTAGKK